MLCLIEESDKGPYVLNSDTIILGLNTQYRSKTGGDEGLGNGR